MTTGLCPVPRYAVREPGSRYKEANLRGFDPPSGFQQRGATYATSPSHRRPPIRLTSKDALRITSPH